MQRSCLPLTAKERVQLPCRTAEPSQPEGNRQGGPDNPHPARGGATGAQAPAQGTGRGHLATQAPREPEPGLWASLCARSHDAAHGTAPARPLRAISCRTVSGTGRGAGVTGTGRAHLGPGSQATRVGPIQREAPFHFKNGQAGFRPERSEAGTEAGGRRRIPARVGPTKQQYRRGRAAPAPRHLLPDRVRHWARGGLSPGRTFTGGANSARSAIPAATPGMPLSGRRAHRRPADGERFFAPLRMTQTTQ